MRNAILTTVRSRPRQVLYVLIGLVAVSVTVLVFISFDRASHSASDTLRPFLITMVPVWVISGAAIRHLRGARSS